VAHVFVFVVMPGRYGAAGKQNQHARQRDDTDKGCEVHFVGVL